MPPKLFLQIFIIKLFKLIIICIKLFSYMHFHVSIEDKLHTNKM